MARAAGKKAPKAVGNTTTPTTQPAQPIQTPSASAVPEPFKALPPALQPFVSPLPKNHVYAIHIDSNPIELKKRVYVIPILLNLAITAILAVRVYYAVPIYLQQIITIFGYDTVWSVEPARMQVGDLAGTISSRTMLLMIDYALFGMLGSWPWEFMFGNRYSRFTGPFGWRWELGFRAKEIVVRKGRKWDSILLGMEVDEPKKSGRRPRGPDGKREPVKPKEDKKEWPVEDELALKFKIEPAMRASTTAKTGYLLLDKNWDLDFKAMIDAHQLVEKGTVKLDDLDHVVLLYTARQWVCWYVHASDIATNATETAGDETLRSFKDKLADLDCEDVFFRWIEIVQYESSLPGGFTQRKQAEAMGELKRLLTERDVDYTKFLDEIGGQKGVPGLSSQP